MGLREKKARLVREAIFEAMLELAEEQGYAAATIEQVAERAEVGVSTVYRYFANKDAILLAPMADHTSRLADAFSARPEEEDVAVSLAQAVSAVLDLSPGQRADLRRLRAQLDVATGPRARLWDVVNQQQVLLEEAIRARTGPDADPLWITTAAHTTTMVLHIALDHDRGTVEPGNPADYARRIIDLLHGPAAPLPKMPPPAQPR
ncbi:TetR/AcrR family transcriptional regulator [Amycolatopsis jejuensis]|uniref:TetR/AcrR family transcriptional regulator n=1 Tax=Amycolatopsis jejuensis TaxID=330084 RepID=UPI00068C7B24|nr:TetR/AcrR family transcriptional regulator [Amycolatopsis jejuensis]